MRLYEPHPVYLSYFAPVFEARCRLGPYIWAENRMPSLGNHFTERQFYAMMDMVFEWDPKKERENVKEHGVYFDTAVQVFNDYHRMVRHDDDSSDYEDRWQTMGFIDDVLFVVFTERGDVTRIISARIAVPSERRIYHGNSEIHGWQRVNP
jgi:uncharacterized DUF497 family protein